MASTADIKKTLTDPKPLYAVAGVGDLAVEKLREVPGRVARLRRDGTYTDLAARGKAIVERIRTQKATQDLIQQAQATVTRARTTRGAAARGSASTRKATKATLTSARETARAAAKATSDGASKVGD
jgi:heparin binding hemagglutinin HbhA